jgi:signal transduction histidine kinase
VAQEGVRHVVKPAEATHVRISLRPPPGLLVLEIADNGRGMDPAATSARRSGSVGLELLRALVAEHEGTLFAGPADGGGTTLVMELPYREVKP